MNERKLRNRLIIDYIGVGLFLIWFIGMIAYGLIVGEPSEMQCECKEEYGITNNATQV